MTNLSIKIGLKAKHDIQINQAVVACWSRTNSPTPYHAVFRGPGWSKQGFRDRRVL